MAAAPPVNVCSRSLASILAAAREPLEPADFALKAAVADLIASAPARRLALMKEPTALDRARAKWRGFALVVRESDGGV